VASGLHLGSMGELRHGGDEERRRMSYGKDAQQWRWYRVL
jgi:hypothetical protein